MGRPGVVEHGLKPPIELLLGVAEVFHAVGGLFVGVVDEEYPRPGVDGCGVVIDCGGRLSPRQQILD